MLTEAVERRATGADRQLEVHARTGDFVEVVHDIERTPPNYPYL